MFRALPAHPQEPLHKRRFGILRACYVSWLHQDRSETAILVQPTNKTRTQHTNTPFVQCLLRMSG
jgi:hypothetical protein